MQVRAKYHQKIKDKLVMKVKFCGFTQSEDLVIALSLGVDAIGLVFYPPSPRYVDFDTACHLVAGIPPFVSVVALVVNMTDDEFIRLSDAVPFDVVQFHGDETPKDCQRLANIAKKRWYKAIRVQESDTAEHLLSQINELKAYGASGVLLDAYHPDKFGGTGQAFDWTKIPTNSPLPIILAGGLTPDNIGGIIHNNALMEKVKGVDVSGGIEKAKGVKCGERMGRFLEHINDK